MVRAEKCDFSCANGKKYCRKFKVNVGKKISKAEKMQFKKEQSNFLEIGTKNIAFYSLHWKYREIQHAAVLTVNTERATENRESE